MPASGSVAERRPLSRAQDYAPYGYAPYGYAVFFSGGYRSAG